MDTPALLAISRTVVPWKPFLVKSCRAARSILSLFFSMVPCSSLGIYPRSRFTYELSKRALALVDEKVLYIDLAAGVKEILTSSTSANPNYQLTLPRRAPCARSTRSLWIGLPARESWRERGLRLDPSWPQFHIKRGGPLVGNADYCVSCFLR